MSPEVELAVIIAAGLLSGFIKSWFTEQVRLECEHRLPLRS
jgi:hypothetical protein